MVMNVRARQTLFKKKKKKFYHGVNPAIFTKIATLICSWEISCLIASLSGDLPSVKSREGKILEKARQLAPMGQGHSTGWKGRRRLSASGWGKGREADSA